MRAELPPAFKAASGDRAVPDDTVRSFVTPKAILWKSDDSGEMIANEAVLLAPGTRQPATVHTGLCTLKSVQGKPAPALLLDFGIEMQGGVQLVMGMTPGKDPVRFRVRLGESVTEAMSDIGGDTNATNDHAMRDYEIQAPWLGSVQAGNSGFRFVRIDLLDKDRTVFLKEVNAIFSYRDIPYLGSFKCSDERLNRIWQTGAYTVHLNMQHYLWDGIKRDRLVWIGDMHPRNHDDLFRLWPESGRSRQPRLRPRHLSPAGLDERHQLLFHVVADHPSRVVPPLRRPRISSGPESLHDPAPAAIHDENQREGRRGPRWAFPRLALVGQQARHPLRGSSRCSS